MKYLKRNTDKLKQVKTANFNYQKSIDEKKQKKSQKFNLIF